MMNASGRILPLLECVRHVGKDKWIARCPAHDDRTPSLTITQSHDRALITCWAGCRSKDIASAIGQTLADWFDEPRTRSRSRDLSAERRRRAYAGLEGWRQWTLNKTCAALRKADRLAASAFAHLGTNPNSDTAWSTLAKAYHATTALEYDFERLNSKDNNNHLAVWREQQDIDHAA